MDSFCYEEITIRQLHGLRNIMLRFIFKLITNNYLTFLDYFPLYLAWNKKTFDIQCANKEHSNFIDDFFPPCHPSLVFFPQLVCIIMIFLANPYFSNVHICCCIDRRTHSGHVWIRPVTKGILNSGRRYCGAPSLLQMKYCHGYQTKKGWCDGSLWMSRTKEDTTAPCLA